MVAVKRVKYTLSQTDFSLGSASDPVAHPAPQLEPGFI